MAKIYGVIYHQKVPTIFNRGSKWEKQRSDFLYVQATKEGGEELAAELNKMLAEGVTEVVRHGWKLDLTNIEYFYVQESCEMY